MVQYCIVPGCGSNALHPGVSFFSFPKDVKQRLSWEIKIRRDERRNVKISPMMRVCSLHFAQDDMHMSKNGKRRVLRDGAVPTIFAFTSPRKNKNRRQLKWLTRSDAVNLLPTQCPQTSSSPCLPSVQRDEICTTDACCTDMDETEEMSIMDACLLNSEPECENGSLSSVIDGLQKKLQENQLENVKLKEKLHVAEQHKCKPYISFSFSQIRNNGELLNYYTGFDTIGMFNEFCKFVSPGERYTFSKKINLQDQLLLVLSKLRQGFDNIDLACRFNITPKLVAHIFAKWINLLYVRLGYLVIWPHRDVILQHAPTVFREKYSNTIMILDCTELKIECPSDLILQSQSYSVYKSHNTVKGLIGCDPRGGLMFISGLFTGSVSDKNITKLSGLYDVLKKKLESAEIHPYDAIMVDKGFNIQKQLEELNISINVPPYAFAPQFDEEEVHETRQIASCRVTVERAIRRIKTFKILHGVIPITLMPHLNQIWTVCCLLTGFRCVTRTEAVPSSS